MATLAEPARRLLPAGFWQEQAPPEPAVGAASAISPVLSAMGNDPDPPDLVDLFGVPDPAAHGWALHPRTAFILDCAISDLLESGEQDIDAYPPDEHSLWGRLPRWTWRQSKPWRENVLGSLEYLIGDIVFGHEPTPRCAAEEFTLWLALKDAEDMTGTYEPRMPASIRALPDHPFEDWTSVTEQIYDFSDVRLIYSPQLDGIEDPDAPENRLRGLGKNFIPANWWITFRGATPRR